METIDDDWMTTVVTDSEMGRAVAAYPWESSPLGSPDTWPDELRSVVSICLSTSFPALVVWGPDLISIYNDGYRPILGRDKHPRALGTAARDMWPEVWDEIGPLFHQVLATGRPTWDEDLELIIERNGYPEECYFTFSYSPVFQDGAVAGVLDLVYETTSQVVANRRLECLSALNAALADAEQVTHVCVATTAALSAHAADVCWADVFLLAGDDIVLVASNRRDDVSPADRIDLGAVVAGQAIVLGGDQDGLLPAGLIAMPLGGTFHGVQGALVAELNPGRPFDRHFRGFVQVLADAVTSALDGAYRRSVEVGEYRRISDTLQEAMLPPSQNLPTIAARYLPAVGSLAVGGDWYDVVDLDDHRRALVVGDCVGHGLDAATVMAQLRAAARAMLLDGRSPAEMLSGLDTFAAHVEGAACATVACVVFDRAARRLTYARAGHPPPLVIGPRGARWLDEPNGPPLAIATGDDRIDSTILVSDDEVILLYSDGLIERRGENLDVGMSRLVDAAARWHGNSAHVMADAVLRDLLPENTRDDVVLVVKRLSEIEPA